MDERTFNYLKGRFGDYYRRSNLTLPPESESREWGLIPWSQQPGDRMKRHISMKEIQNIVDFLGYQKPKHVYMSSAKYEHPGEKTMEEKEWKSADLIFDLDAKDVESVTKEDEYTERLEKCKQATIRLYNILVNDFDFNDISIVFSGGRGFHIHVRDKEVQKMSSESRSEIVDYIRGRNFNLTRLEEQNPSNHGTWAGQVAQFSGGFYSEFYKEYIDYLNKIKNMEDEKAKEELQEYDRIGEKTAEKVLNTLNNRLDFAAGNLTVNNSMKKLTEKFCENYKPPHSAEIDEPVTNDTTRLIRFPMSLHGGTGLQVIPIPEDKLKNFSPTEDAIPEIFKNNTIRIKALKDTKINWSNDTINIEEGKLEVPEYIGIFLMAQGDAEKIKEI